MKNDKMTLANAMMKLNEKDINVLRINYEETRIKDVSILLTEPMDEDILYFLKLCFEKVEVDGKHLNITF